MTYGNRRLRLAQITQFHSFLFKRQIFIPGYRLGSHVNMAIYAWSNCGLFNGPE